MQRSGPSAGEYCMLQLWRVANERRGGDEGAKGIKTRIDTYAAVCLYV